MTSLKLRWEFIKERCLEKKKGETLSIKKSKILAKRKENTQTTRVKRKKTRARPRNKKENTILTKKIRKF